MSFSVRLSWHQQAFEALPGRALHWPAASTLLVSDLHWGKTAAFRRAGIPAPPQDLEADLRRLTDLLRETQAQRLLILGDLFHARAGCDAHTLDQISDWRAQHHSLKIVLVSGNHDRHAGAPPPHWRIACVGEELREAGLRFVHAPPDEPEAPEPTLCGHLHPAIVLRGGGAEVLRAPCFWFRQRVAVLPAFGFFTGSRSIRAAPGERVLAVGPDCVVDVSRRQPSRSA